MNNQLSESVLIFHVQTQFFIEDPKWFKKSIFLLLLGPDLKKAIGRSIYFYPLLVVVIVIAKNEQFFQLENNYIPMAIQ